MDISSLIWFLIVGLIAGALARFLVPGPDPMGILGTILLGIVGSFVGGTLYALIFAGDLDFRASNFIGSLIGAIVALLIYRAVASRSGARA